MGSIVTLIQCLPQILALIKSVEKAIADAQAEVAVKDQLVKVKAAFDNKDATSLNALFNK
jgi:hypothetical protein